MGSIRKERGQLFERDPMMSGYLKSDTADPLNVHVAVHNPACGKTSNSKGPRENSIQPSLVECCCNETWVEFTQSTTLHGLRFIWLDGTFPLRRIFWLLMVLVCCGIMAFQIIDRIIYYYDWPVTVNVQVNYNTTLLFPKVTICNQNAFRATVAAEAGRYHLLTSMFDSTYFNISDLDRYNACDATFEEIYLNSSHKKEDLIIGCQWRGEDCGPGDFVMVLTDHGVCYTFNSPQDSSQQQGVVFSSGAENGLALTLNSEQYEYMPGPHDAAGVKILIHDDRQFPKVNELGIALPTGTHSFVGMQLISVVNLPEPHGQCRSPKLKYFANYSLENCEMDCFTQLLEKKCGCRLRYMPHTNGYPPVCTLGMYYSCYLENKDELRRRKREDCDCPVPCEFLIFDPTVSYATTSLLAVDNFLAMVNGTALQRRYNAARDVTNRLQRDRVEELQGMISDVDRKFLRLKQLVLTDIADKLRDQRTAVKNMSDDLLRTWSTTYRYYRYQHYIVLKNFVRARDAMNERTFSVLAQGVQEFSFSVEDKIKQLVNPDLSDDSVRQVLFVLIQSQLNARIDIAVRALQNYTQLFGAYMNASSIFNYKFENFSRSESQYIVPKYMLTSAYNRTKTIRRRSIIIAKHIQYMAKWMMKYRNISETAYYNNTLDKEALHHINIRFLYWSREYLQSRSMFLHDMIDWPVYEMENRERLYAQLKDEYNNHRTTMLSYIDSVSQLLSNVKESILKEVDTGIRLCKMYIEIGNISKLEVARHFSSKRVNTGINDLRLFFETLRNRGQNIFDNWDRLSAASKKIWNFTLSDRDMETYYQFKNLTQFLRSVQSVSNEITAETNNFRDSLDLRFLVGNSDGDFFQSLETLMEHMAQFLARSDVDGTFIRENFVRLNIFYRELNYEQIRQQEAYDIFALLCDIGGSMGLFVGASVMTIFEIMDFIFINAINQNKSKR